MATRPGIFHDNFQRPPNLSMGWMLSRSEPRLKLKDWLREPQALQSKQAFNTGSSIASSSTRQGAGIQLSRIRRSAEMEKVSKQTNFEGRSEAASINQTAATEAARLRMASTVVTGFFRGKDRRLEEMKPKY